MRNLLLFSSHIWEGFAQSRIENTANLVSSIANLSLSANQFGIHGCLDVRMKLIIVCRLGRSSLSHTAFLFFVFLRLNGLTVHFFLSQDCHEL